MYSLRNETFAPTIQSNNTHVGEVTAFLLGCSLRRGAREKGGTKVRRHGEIGLSEMKKGGLNQRPPRHTVRRGCTYEISLTCCPVVGAIVCMAGEERDLQPRRRVRRSIEVGRSQAILGVSGGEQVGAEQRAIDSRVRVKVFALGLEKCTEQCVRRARASQVRALEAHHRLPRRASES